jgi:hypothetical protein
VAGAGKVAEDDQVIEQSRVHERHVVVRDAHIDLTAAGRA